MNDKSVIPEKIHIVGIGGVTKDIEGAIITKVEIGEHTLPLKCHIVRNMKFPIVLVKLLQNLMNWIWMTKNQLWIVIKAFLRN